MRPSHKVPEISVKRLVPTKVKTKKTVCSIRPDEKAYVEQLDNDSNIKYCLEVDCRSQSAVYYTPRDFQGNPLPQGAVPYAPREDYHPEHYYHPNIPKKVLKMWQHLHKFVELVKAKTPKVFLLQSCFSQGQITRETKLSFQMEFKENSFQRFVISNFRRTCSILIGEKFGYQMIFI